MMPVILSEDAQDQSTFVVEVSFLDEEGTPVVPQSAMWSLHDANGNVINGRLNVNIPGLATTVDVVLSGDDLDYELGPFRQLSIVATYNSSLGLGLPLTGEVNFEIQDVEGA
jgi:hypothetical protein